MYGLVNKALEEMVGESDGADAWNAVCRQAGVDDEVFIANRTYADDSTYRLVGALAAHRGQPPEQVLRDFGRYWVMGAGQRYYGHMLRSAGASISEFLRELPHFHTRVALMMPAIVPPDFQSREVSPGHMEVTYRSTRLGLGPFVEGLFDGIGAMFGTAVRVTAEPVAVESGTCIRYDVRWG